MSFFGSASKAAKVQHRWINKGRNALNAAYDEAEGLIGENLDQYQPFEDMYANALGLNGEAGGQEATEAYRSGPSYNILQDVLADATRRWGLSQSAKGSLKSGRALEELGRRTADIQLQDYTRNWLDHLFRNSGQSSNARGTLANLAVGRGQSEASALQAIGGGYANAKAAGNPLSSLVGPLLGSALNVATGGAAGGAGSFTSLFGGG